MKRDNPQNDCCHCFPIKQMFWVRKETSQGQMLLCVKKRLRETFLLRTKHTMYVCNYRQLLK